MNNGYKEFLKIDTQGYEMKVLKGVEKNIHKICALQLELSISPLYDNPHLYQDFFNYLEKEVLNVGICNLVLETQKVVGYFSLMDYLSIKI